MAGKRKVCNTFVAGLIVPFLYVTSFRAQDSDRTQQNIAENSRGLRQELREALEALRGNTTNASQSLKFRATYSFNGQTQSTFDIDQRVSEKGEVQQSRALTSDGSRPPERIGGRRQLKARFVSVWEDSYLYNPAAGLAYLLRVTGLKLYRFQKPEDGRTGILISQMAEDGVFIPAQAWFLSSKSHLPEELIIFRPSATGGPPMLDNDIVYEGFTEGQQVMLPRRIRNKIRTGQTLTITLDEPGVGAESK